MNLRNIVKCLFILLLLLSTGIYANAANESYLETLTGKIKKGDSCTTVDDKFLHLSTDNWNQLRNLSVVNMITFELRQDTNVYYQSKPFTCTLELEIKYFSTRDQVKATELKDIKLVVKFDTATGAQIRVADYYQFKNAYRVTVVVKSIQSAEWGDKLPPAFRIKNQILVDRKYPFYKEFAPAAKLQRPSKPILQKEKLTEAETLLKLEAHSSELFFADNVLEKSGTTYFLSWDPANLDNGSSPHYDEYDLEWMYIDWKSTRGQQIRSSYTDNTGKFTVPDNVLEEWMQNDNTRVTMRLPAYSTNIVYPGGYVFFRIRGVSYESETNPNLRSVTNWIYRESSNPSSELLAYELKEDVEGVPDEGHEPDFNWQYTAAFAEEGKRREMMTYLDATLRNRQSITLNNTGSRNVAVAAETIYDKMGRAAIQVLPAPLNESSLKYYPSLSKNNSGNPYSFSDITPVSYNGVCSITAAPMSTASGASLYYSPQNVFLNNNDYYYTKYIPDAQQYPFSLTEYTADNTGRVRNQGGVGPQFQVGSPTKNPTRYFYGKPLQEELDRLFGTEAGNASHYLKNMVVDANGQASVSYLNASGKTVATALAGVNPDGMDALPSLTQSGKTKKTLMRSGDFTRDASTLVMQAAATFTTATRGTHTIFYSVKPAALVTTTRQNATICSNCYYEVLVEVKNDCGLVASKTSVPFSGNNVACSASTLDVTDNVDFEVEEVGEFTVTYTLRLSEEQEKIQEDYYIAHNTDLKSLQAFFRDELLNAQLEDCYSDCVTCIEKLGTKPGFTAKMQQVLLDLYNEKYKDKGLVLDINHTEIQQWISMKYDEMLGECQNSQATCMNSPCDDKLQMLKNDVTPGGQYALYDPATFLIKERETSVLVHYTHSDFATFTFVDDNGKTISSKTLGEADFVKAYIAHPEWADEFVKRHIEYCSYLWCNSHAYIYSFERTLKDMVKSGQEALNKGYYSKTDLNVLLNADPFFATGNAGASWKLQMQKDIAEASTTLGMTTGFAYMGLDTKNILQLVDWALYCRPTTRGATAADDKQLFINSWQGACAPAEACRSINREWEIYRDYYLQFRGKYIQLAKHAYDPTCVNCFIGKDGLTAKEGTCVKVKGSASNGLFTATLLKNYTPDTPQSFNDEILSEAWTCNGFGVPNCNFRTLLRYDVSSIPANAGIQSAKLYLYAKTDNANGYRGQPTYGDNNASLLQFVTSPHNPATATWNNTVVATANQKILAKSSSEQQHYIVDVTDFVAQWVADPSSNAGMLLRQAAEVPLNSMIFHSGNAPADMQPTLEICYNTDGLSVSAPQLAFFACNNLYNAAPVCPNMNEFFQKEVKLEDESWILGGPWDFYQESEQFHKASYVKTSGTSGRPLQLRVRKDHWFYNGTHEVDYSEVTMPADAQEVVIGTNYSYYIRQGDYINSHNYTYTVESFSCPGYINPLRTSCTEDPRFDDYQNKARVFLENTSVVAAGGCGYLFSSESDNYNAIRVEAGKNLEALKENWRATLIAVRDEEGFPAGNTDPLSDSKINSLVDALYIFAKTTLDSSPNDDIRPSTEADNSFRDIFTLYVPEVYKQRGFNENLLAEPYPHTVKPYYTNPNISEASADICINLSAFRTRWANAGSPEGTFYNYLKKELDDDFTLTPEQLNDLENKCSASCPIRVLSNPMLIPVAFAPALKPGNKHPWITCSDLNSALSDYGTYHSQVVTGSRMHRVTLTNFLNHRFGFALSYDEYTGFIAKCSTATGAVLYNKPASPLVPPADDFACAANLIRNAFTKAAQEWERYIALERIKFRNNYFSVCLANQVSAKLESAQYEYHYTLYYYDQAGNLIKTIPPEGVTFLEGSELEQVETYRGNNPEACIEYNGPKDERAATTFTNVGIQMAAGTAKSMEMWLYSNDGTFKRQVRFSTPDKKYLCQVAINDNKIWAEVYSLLPDASGSFELTLTNQAYASLASLPAPLINWTHVVVQSVANSIKGGDDLQLYVDGQKLTTVTNGGIDVMPGYPFEWEIVPGVLPANDLAVLKHIRLYRRTASDAEILANFKNQCLTPKDRLAYYQTDEPSGAPNVQQFPLTVWGRFNMPAAGSETTIDGQTEWAGRLILPKHSLPTLYTYNSFDEIVKQTSPDAGTSEFYYDRLGKLVVSQNAEQKNPAQVSVENPANRFSYTKYDLLGRVVETGEKTGSTKPINLSTALSETSLRDWYGDVNSSNRQVTYTAYDEVPSWGTPPGFNLHNLRKRISGSALITNGSNPSVNREAASYYSYDALGNASLIVQENALMAASEKQYLTNSSGYKFIEYDYDLISGKVNRVTYQRGKYDQYYYDYRYDAENRLIGAYSGSNSSLLKRDANYTYYLHGPLARTELGREGGVVQGVDYAYTLQGWLKGVNGQFLDADKGMMPDGIRGAGNFGVIGRDAMAYSLGYYKNDYKAIGGSSATAFGKQFAAPGSASSGVSGLNLFNGNISSVTYAIKAPSLNDGATFANIYRYDQLNRVKEVNRKDVLTSDNSDWTYNIAQTAYKETFSYDGNGNIKTSTRYDATHLIDQLTYNYSRDNSQKLMHNRLGYITDEADHNGTGSDIKPQSPEYYKFDKIGNLISEGNNDVVKFSWTAYGKLSGFEKGGVSNSYKYDAYNSRISQKRGQNATYYVRDGQGAVLGVYVLDASGWKWSEQHLYGNSRLGLVFPGRSFSSAVSDDSYNLSGDNTSNLGARRFELSNHLGNVFATVSDNRLLESTDNSFDYKADVQSAQDYYAFGMLQSGRNYNPGAYRYGFNGKENDNDIRGEGNQQDYGMRIYDPRIGRFLSVDPITGEYPELTPYQFASNRPIDGIDQDGLERLPLVPRFQNSGNRTLSDYAGEFDNAFIDLVNFIPTFWNSGVESYQALRRGTYVKDLKSQTNAMVSGLNQKAQKLVSEPITTLTSPEAFGFYTSIYLTPKTFTVVGNAKNLVKTTTASTTADATASTTAGAAAGTAAAGTAASATTGSKANITGRWSGRSRDLNPTGGNMNCANCAVAGDLTLKGIIATATNILKKPMEGVLNDAFFGMWGKKLSQVFVYDSPTPIINAMSKMPDGATGVIMGFRGAGQTGHYMNVVKQNGIVKFVDFQLELNKRLRNSSTLMSDYNFKQLYFINTTGITPTGLLPL